MHAEALVKDRTVHSLLLLLLLMPHLEIPCVVCYFAPGGSGFNHITFLSSASNSEALNTSVHSFISQKRETELGGLQPYTERQPRPTNF